MKKRLSGWFSGETIDYREVLSIVLPVVIDQFFLVGFSFVNTAMISSSGTEAISAVNMVGSIHFFLVQFFVSIGLGGTVLIAQYLGKRQLRKIGPLVGGTLYGSLGTALLMSGILLIFHETVLNLLFGGAEKAVLDNARIYLLGLLLMYPLQSIVEGTNGCLRGMGRTKSSLKLSMIMNAINVVFNVIFINFLHLGVQGLAYSVNISRWITAALAIYTIYANRELFGLRKRHFTKVPYKLITKILKVAVPFATESLMFNGGKIVMQILIVSLGTNVIAANAITSSWVQLSEIIPNALSISLVPIVGRCIGAQQIADARKFAKTFVCTGMAAFLTVDLLLLPLFPLGMTLFKPPAAMVPLIYQIYLWFILMHFFAWSISFVLPAALRAAGDANFTTVVSMTTMWVFRIGVGYFVGIKLGYGLFGIYLVMSLEWALRGTIFLLRFKGTKWYSKSLI